MTLFGQFMLDLQPGQTNRTNPDKTDKPDICGGPIPGQNGQMPLGMSVMSGGSGVSGVRVQDFGKVATRRAVHEWHVQAMADWVKAGRPGDPPNFPPGYRDAAFAAMMAKQRSGREARQWRK